MCSRRHEKHVNSLCPYFKLALRKCTQFSISADDCRLYLPELDAVDRSTGEYIDSDLHVSPVTKELLEPVNGKYVPQGYVSPFARQC